MSKHLTLLFQKQ